MIKAIPPVPIDRDDWGPSYTLNRGHHNVDKYYPGPNDAQGMYPRPPGYHGGWDIFSLENYPCVAPFAGRIVHRSESRGTSGSVYGGVIGVESVEGVTIILRHITPLLGNGVQVAPGDLIAKVSPWSSGTPHAHMECYRYWPASYDISGTIDPSSIEWVSLEDLQQPVLNWYIEDMPHNKGGIGPAIVGQEAGYAHLSVARTVAAAHKVRGRLVSIMKDRNKERFFVLWWLPGTYKNGLPIFGEGNSEEWAIRARKRREAALKKKVRIFRGRQNSLYPHV